MSRVAVSFERVSKSYPLYHHMLGGFKHFIFNLPGSFRALRQSRFEALREVSFEVREGETFGLIGRNGAGKSTALGLIAGVLAPTTGKVTVKGRIAPLLELGAGFHTDLTGRENIVLNGVLMGLTRAEVLGRIDQIIAFAELGEFIDQPIRIYSTGMLTRLGFAVAAHLDPEILLVDEVLAVGDAQFQKKCLDKMAEFKTNGVTIVFVSHGLEDVKRICDRVAWIDNHTVRQVGSAEEVVLAYTNDMSGA
jgi:lipopolysaccharide transport system ATP-binding protein